MFIDSKVRKVSYGWGSRSEVFDSTPDHSMNNAKTWKSVFKCNNITLEVFCYPIQAQAHIRGFPFIVSSTFAGGISERLRFVFGNVFGVQVVHSGECGL